MAASPSACLICAPHLLVADKLAVFQQADANDIRNHLPVLVNRLSKFFILLVVAPTLLSAGYFGAVAADIYVSESRFVLRSPQRQASGGLATLLQGGAFTRSQDDAYSIHEFALSRDALQELEKSLSIKQRLSTRTADFIARFPAPWEDDTFESLYRHYRQHVSIDYDPVSSISVLRVRAFSAADARDINENLLQLSEQLVNTLNDRARRDLVHFASMDVKMAEEKARDAALALSAFRTRQTVFDPDKQSALQLQGIAKLQEELHALEAQVAQLRQISPNNAQLPVLRGRADTLRNVIAAETAKVAGGAASLTSKAAHFERLSLEKGFADRQLAAALSALDVARSEAQRKQLYLERLAQPNLPDQALEPRRLRATVTTMLTMAMLWAILVLLVAALREHME